eukprot:8662841-Alexandrium_andersonii.AAC.1
MRPECTPQLRLMNTQSGLAPPHPPAAPRRHLQHGSIACLCGSTACPASARHRSPGGERLGSGGE